MLGGITTYTYDDLGLLATVTAPDSVPFRYTRTSAGRVDSLILGTGVREKRTYDADGRLTFRNRISDVLSPNLLVSDSLFYDEADHIVRASELVRNQQADQTRISYDGLGAVVAREQGNQLGSNVEEFRNDAFGNVLRRVTRKSGGSINSAPFVLSYSPKGELNSWLTQLNTPPASQYQRKDDLSQNFLSGRMTRQSEVVQNPNDNQYDYQLAARLYYGSDDRLMAVERYSWKTDALRDGTWEEYRYDALGRRILTRVRRNGGSPYDNSPTIAPLCQSSTIPVCRSFTEMVWWDGDQALVENRTAEGTADVSNNGTVGNVNGLTLDEPLAVYTTYPSTELRIINYNWRGQGLSSVTSSGAGADATTGGSAIVDWPAMTQAETYFTPSVDASGPDNTPRKWLGTFVQNGQGTTGMLYRRNRYFDPNTGRFTQEDPIGIAGGLNAYGFAEGDPVNFSDPFGLCNEGVRADSASQTGKHETTIYCQDGSVEIRQGGTWTWRNYNPGNVRASSLSAGKSGGFSVFGNRSAGNEAMWRQFMLDAGRRLTLASMIEKYAPRFENNTDAYIAFVSKRSGVAPKTPLNTLTETTISAIIRAMQEHEGWQNGTVIIR